MLHFVAHKPSSLKAPVSPSMTFPHHPDAHGTAVTPGSVSMCDALNLNGSLQLPKSPRDRH